MKYYLKIYGCLFNYADAQRIKTILNNKGYQETHTPESAKTIIIITCSVRQKAEDRTIHFAKKYAKDKIVILTGCMVRRDYLDNSSLNTLKRIEELIRLLPYAYFIDISNIEKLPNLLADIKEKSKKKSLIKKYLLERNKEKNYYEKILPTYSDKDNPIASIPIMTGCNEMCTYCVVPYSRGQEVYRSPESISEEVKLALSKGKKIIYLLGQIVDKWHWGSYNFLDLLKEITTIPQQFFLGFISPHPNYITKDIIDFIATNPKMLKHLGLPLQAGSNKVLRLMNRKYTVEKYLKIARYAKNKIKDLYLTTDIIVGFPGESQEDFDSSLDIIKKLRFDKIFLAKYSPRINTYHKEIVNKVKYQKELTKRFDILNKMATKIFAENNAKRVGNIYKAVILNKQTALLQTNQYVELEKHELPVGNIVTTKIIAGGRRGLKGKILKEEML